MNIFGLGGSNSGALDISNSSSQRQQDADTTTITITTTRKKKRPSFGRRASKESVPAPALATPAGEGQGQHPPSETPSEPHQQQTHTHTHSSSSYSFGRQLPPHTAALSVKVPEDNPIVFQGWVTDERSADSKPKRFLVLEGTTLCFYTDEKNTSPVVGQENVVEKLPLASDSVLDFDAAAGKGNNNKEQQQVVFVVRSGGVHNNNNNGISTSTEKAFAFSCEGGKDNDEWIERIQETIESIKRRSDRGDLSGLLGLGQSSVLSTPTTRGGDTMCMERGTPASDGRLQMSAPSLHTPSEYAYTRSLSQRQSQPATAGGGTATSTTEQQQGQEEQEDQQPTALSSGLSPPSPAQAQAQTETETQTQPIPPHLVPLHTPSSSQKCQQLHLTSSSPSTRAAPTTTSHSTTTTHTHQPPLHASGFHTTVNGTTAAMASHAWPAPVPAQQPTPWGEAGEDGAAAAGAGREKEEGRGGEEEGSGNNRDNGGGGGGEGNGQVGSAMPPHMHLLPASPRLVREGRVGSTSMNATARHNSGGGGGGGGGGNNGLDETTGALMGMTMRTSGAVVAGGGGGGEGQEDGLGGGGGGEGGGGENAAVGGTGGVARREEGGGGGGGGGLTTSALERLAGNKPRPNPEREDIISMEERKARVEEGMRRTKSAARLEEQQSQQQQAQAQASTTTSSSSSTTTHQQQQPRPKAKDSISGTAEEDLASRCVYQGWVKMSRRKWYMVLMGAPPRKNSAAAPAPAPAPAPAHDTAAPTPTDTNTSAHTTGGKASSSSSPKPSATTTTTTSITNNTTNNGGRKLALYSNPTDLQTKKSPKETILLTADCIIESRRLPIAGTDSSGSSTGSSGSGGGSSTSSLLGRGVSGGQRLSFSTPSTGMTAASFSDTLEPDSVVDLLITNSRTGLLKTITFQCFTVEEENRWISELQMAIGVLSPLEDCEGSPGFLGGFGLGGMARELSEHVQLLPHVCCTVS